MIVLWLLVAHLVGDYLLQTRWQAIGKFGWDLHAVGFRMKHCYAYALPFIPIGLVYGGNDYGTLAFWLLLVGLHFLTDAQRFENTIGDAIGWRYRTGAEKVAEWRDYGASTVGKTSDSLPANPWPSIGLAIDQTLHLIQIAVLAQIFLT